MDAVRPIVENTTVREADQFLAIGPCIVSDSSTLLEVARSLTEAPGARVISVVGADNKLAGVVSAQELFEDVLFQIAPENFLADIVDYQHSVAFAHLAGVRTIKDVMDRPVCVTMDNTVAEAFHLMHEHRLMGLPIVDQGRRVIGYVDMLELLLVWLKAREAEKE